MDPPIEEIFKYIDPKKQIISFGMGVPFFSPSTELIENFWAKVKSNPNLHQYSPDLGFQSARNEVTKFLNNRSRSDISWKNVILTSGANLGFYNLITMLTEPKDEVIILSPFYFNHLMALQINQVVPIEINTDKNFNPIFEQITKKINHKTKAIVVINPNNPTGAVYNNSIIEQLLEICEQYNLLLLCDETYAEFIYKEGRITRQYYSNASDRLIRVGSFSKIFGIPGWRIGYIVLPDSYLSNYIKIQDTTAISPPSISQLFVEFLLKKEADLISPNEKALVESRQTMLQLLEENPHFEVIPTHGAFYFFVKLLISMNGEEFATNLASKKNIIVLPGSISGSNYDQFVRFSYASINKELIEKGFEKISDYNKSLL
jgi:aspartate/methionine/tyrosine aminotransferase